MTGDGRSTSATETRPTRPLPQVTPFNEWFWTSGSDGNLRVQACADCDKYTMPPSPVCPACHSTAVEHRIVPGTGTVIGVSVSYQQWLPDFEPPYAVVNVSVDGAPGVNLTSNVTGCAPEDVHVGQRVAVYFEQHEDVWIPLFAPVPGEPDGVGIVDGPHIPAPRPAPTRDRFEHQSVLSGIGRSAIGRRLMADPIALAVDASLKAIADAGLEPRDIDGISTYPGPGPGGMSEGGATAIEDALRLHPTWINGGMDLPGPGGSLIGAMLAISAGLCRHVLCVRTVWESTSAQLGLRPPMGDRVSGPFYEWRAPFGAMSPSTWIGLNASQYMKKYGATRELLGYVAINGRTGAGRNPDAIYRDPMTMDDYMSARMISTPFGLYDCDVPCDASIAVIVSAAEVAGDLPHKAIRIESVGTQILERVSWDQDVVTHEPQVLGQSKHLWSRSSLTPDDVDLALVYDGFTFNAVSWLEGLGFCGLGEAKDWIDGGRTIALGGALPVNPHGGQLSEGRTHGFGFLHEAVLQLRHDAGERQVTEARTAVVTSGGGTPSGVLLLQRDGA